MKRFLAILAILFTATFARESLAGVCQGKFANPVTDICWSCMFPMTLGGRQTMDEEQEDTPNPEGFLCSCMTEPTIGVKTAFWEPVRRVDVTRTPYCFVSLGGMTIDTGIHAPEGEVRLKSDNTKSSSYQVHWYVDPALYYLELMLDDPCVDSGTFDIGYITEVDPSWQDDELTMLLEPETFLFSNPVAQAACAGDCVLSSTGFGSNELFWCAGCQGSLYPMNGHVQAHVSHVQASSLIVQRMTAKLHRQFLMEGSSGERGLCGNYMEPVMDKTNYKYQMIYPIPQTEKINGRCCQPFGRTTAIWGAGKSYPYKGEDFAYMIFRKKNCCSGMGLQ